MRLPLALETVLAVFLFLRFCLKKFSVFLSVVVQACARAERAAEGADGASPLLVPQPGLPAHAPARRGRYEGGRPGAGRTRLPL